MSNAVLEWIYQVLGNLVHTYNSTQTCVDEYDLWLGILAATEIVMISTTDILKGYSPGQLIFVRDMILPIKHDVDWELIRQKKQM